MKVCQEKYVKRPICFKLAMHIIKRTYISTESYLMPREDFGMLGDMQ